MINVAVKQGWASGAWHTRQFEAALKAAGYEISDDLHADVVIAHSVACYDLKIKSPTTYFILIDPPYKPGRNIMLRFAEKQIQDIKTLTPRYGKKYVIKKILWGVLYAIIKPQYLALAIKNADKLDFLDQLKEKNVLVIRNTKDQICSADIKVALAAYPDFYYWETPGEHDDYYTNPQPYIDLLPTSL
jgi:hypothetical protein